MIWFWVAAGAGVLLLVSGYLVPMHIRATDASVLKAAGADTPSLSKLALSFLGKDMHGPASVLSQIISAGELPDRSRLTIELDALAKSQPALQLWGGPRPKWAGNSDPRKTDSGFEPFADYAVRKENRERLLNYLQNTRHPGAAELLKCRQLTNTVIFPPSWTSSGQAFDAAIAITGLLMADDFLNPSLNGAVRKMTSTSLQGNNPQQLEQLLLDFMSLGQRLNWWQLTSLARTLESPETLRRFTELVRRTESDLPALYSASLLSGNPAGVVGYLMSFSGTGVRDLRSAMHENTGGLLLLIERNKRLRHSPADNLLNNYAPFHYLPVLAWKAPAAALALKWLLFLGAGYLFALAAHLIVRRRASRYDVFTSDTAFLRRDSNETGRPLALPPVRGFHVAREMLFSLGFLAVVLLFTEPYLTHDAQRVEFPIRLRIPMAGTLAAASPANTTHASFMNQLSLLTLLLFFVLQALIYTACMFKLAEVRRQKVGPRMKLKLLDNEEHLFDAGLYLGFVGTIISLIMVSLGVIKPSLMAAYSSTSFGIIFVSAFKIFNLRPLKRQLLLEAEAVSPDAPITEGSRPQAIP